MYSPHSFVSLASPKILPLTSSSNVTTRPIKQAYWHSLLHLFGKIQIKFGFSLTYSYLCREIQEL